MGRHFFLMQIFATFVLTLSSTSQFFWCWCQNVQKNRGCIANVSFNSTLIKTYSLACQKQKNTTVHIMHSPSSGCHGNQNSLFIIFQLTGIWWSNILSFWNYVPLQSYRKFKLVNEHILYNVVRYLNFLLFQDNWFRRKIILCYYILYIIILFPELKCTASFLSLNSLITE